VYGATCSLLILAMKDSIILLIENKYFGNFDRSLKHGKKKILEEAK
jgi:hypothetical protein